MDFSIQTRDGKIKATIASGYMKTQRKNGFHIVVVIFTESR